jgi:hypothetical protein
MSTPSPTPSAPPILCPRCGLPSKQHSSCKWCGGPDQHHDDTTRAQCLEGRARMAWAKREAGGDLNPLDIDALEACPTPTILTPTGYQAPTSVNLGP